MPQEFKADPNLWFNIINDNDKGIVEKQLQELFNSHETTPIEHRIYHKNGAVKWVLNTSVAHLSPEGDLTGYDGLISDITVRKTLENQILNSVIETEERERLHFSQELHDGLGPLLSSIKMFVQWLAKPEKKIESNKILNQLEKLIDESTNTVREVSFKLNPHILQNYGLAEAIKAYAAKINESSKINFVLKLDTLCRFDEKIETIVYRVLCECINNTLKHAHAKKIKIEVACQNNLLYINYSDDGKGFDKDTILASHKGIGLTNMQSRLKAINGNMDIYSIPGSGTTIKFQITLIEK
jgi:signal transduction histidine kinase